MSDEGLAFPPVFVHAGWKFREGAAPRPALPSARPCVICGGALTAAHAGRICLRCGFLAECPQG